MDFQTWHELTDRWTINLFEHDYLWLHLVAHVVLVVMPTVFFGLAVWFLFRIATSQFNSQHQFLRHFEKTSKSFYEIPDHILSFVAKYSIRQQLLLGIGAVATIPITYFSLELPKRIINFAISEESFQDSGVSDRYTQVDYLLILCGLYLLVLLMSGALKYLLNLYKGGLSESLIRRLRLFLYRRKFGSRKTKDNSALIPVIIQEVEPVCGFSGDSIVVPLLQGGTVITIVTFMMVQNVALGAAAITLVPIQLIVIPRFQKKINALVQKRVALVRILSNNLTIGSDEAAFCKKKATIQLFTRLQDLRLQLFRTKYLSKSVNNFIMNLTPFFFYTIGGYLVIEGNLSIGALVASLASYKDLSSSIRELFAYYQSYQDARVRYKEIYGFAVRH